VFARHLKPGAIELNEMGAGAAAIKHEAQQPIRKGLCQWLVDSF
jgi:hypothetical protein